MLSRREQPKLATLDAQDEKSVRQRVGKNEHAEGQLQCTRCKHPSEFALHEKYETIKVNIAKKGQRVTKYDGNLVEREFDEVERRVVISFLLDLQHAVHTSSTHLNAIKRPTHTILFIRSKATADSSSYSDARCVSLPARSAFFSPSRYISARPTHAHLACQSGFESAIYRQKRLTVGSNSLVLRMPIRIVKRWSSDISVSRSDKNFSIRKIFIQKI